MLLIRYQYLTDGQTDKHADDSRNSVCIACYTDALLKANHWRENCLCHEYLLEHIKVKKFNATNFRLSSPRTNVQWIRNCRGHFWNLTPKIVGGRPSFVRYAFVSTDQWSFSTTCDILRDTTPQCRKMLILGGSKLLSYFSPFVY